MVRNTPVTWCNTLWVSLDAYLQFGRQVVLTQRSAASADFTKLWKRFRPLKVTFKGNGINESGKLVSIFPPK